MGSKTNARSQRRKARKIQAEEEEKYSWIKRIPSATFECLRHPDNNLDKLLHRLHKTQEIDGRALQKYMPQTVQDLRNGKLVSDDFLHGIGAEYIRKFKVQELCFPDLSIIRPMVNGVVEKTLANHKGVLSEAEFESFRDDVLRIYNSHCEKDVTPAGRAKFIPVEARHRRSEWKFVIDNVCEKWGGILDAKMGAADGTFLRDCPLYGLTQHEMYYQTADAYPVLNNDSLAFVKIQKQLSWAVAGILDGTLDTKKSCWECGEPIEAVAFTCCKCDTASYCGKECQTKAWYSGHKRVCKLIPAQRQLFEQSLRTIEEKHSTPHALISRKESDYAILSIIFSMPPSLATLKNSTKNQSEGPSMSIFLSNLDRIQSGEWWILEQVPSMEDYTSQLGRAGPDAEDVELEHFCLLAHFVSFDWSGTPMHGLLSKIRMPAERFVQLYYELHGRRWLDQEGAAWEKRRRMLAKNAWAGFRSAHHKVALPLKGLSTCEKANEGTERLANIPDANVVTGADANPNVDEGRADPVNPNVPDETDGDKSSAATVLSSVGIIAALVFAMVVVNEARYSLVFIEEAD